ncbi:carboxymuconolactone decarboxylase family protein [Fervidobacterium pennivorans subsp. shakshaketiis]|uniref:carboxymuconolactone decarboxylase family protein n=1 Tax=Fervidobacterium pennivorans TaxID=93466 RepID=UPI0014367132|nr:carboxymuconolactone decarboxylase family protein [Fervidobacterium pennivorans]QIV77895.1 carboxymuconolactone decarboxylase family protein [Fervidobacterium pennivorans subsp. keratinolyticus]
MSENTFNTLEEFKKFRERMNKEILDRGTINTKRFWNLDGAVYREGAIEPKYKELMGLVASMVLRCDDCITYHMIRCAELGVTDEEFFETFDIALIVGGSIVIPHLRRAVNTLLEIRRLQANGESVSV